MRWECWRPGQRFRIAGGELVMSDFSSGQTYRLWLNCLLLLLFLAKLSPNSMHPLLHLFRSHYNHRHATLHVDKNDGKLPLFFKFFKAINFMGYKNKTWVSYVSMFMYVIYELRFNSWNPTSIWIISYQVLMAIEIFLVTRVFFNTPTNYAVIIFKPSWKKKLPISI